MGTRSTNLTLRILIIDPTINSTRGALRILSSIRGDKTTIDIIVIDFGDKVAIVLYSYWF